MVYDGGDGEQGADSVEEESPDEDGSVSEFPQDPCCVTEGCQGVCAIYIGSTLDEYPWIHHIKLSVITYPK